MPILSFPQTVKIQGYVVFNENNNPMYSAEVGFNSKYKTTVNEKGNFELVVPKKILRRKLKVTYMGCFTINFINLPRDENTIYLDTIPMFEYFPGYDMTHFNCSPDDFECKKKKEQHQIQENKRIQDYYSAVNKSIMEYIYTFKGSAYPIDYKTGNINLRRR